MPRSSLRPSVAVSQHRQAIREILLRHSASNPRIFGSVARGDDTLDSDLNLLVDHGPDRTLSLFDLAAMDVEVAALLAVPVQVVTPASLPLKVRLTAEREAVAL